MDVSTGSSNERYGYANKSETPAMPVLVKYLKYLDSQ